MTLFRRYRGYVLLSLVWIIITAGSHVAARWPHPAPIEILPPLPSPTLVPTMTPSPIRVHVSGAVRTPDVYELPVDSIVKDAIIAAGGMTEQADPDAINWACPLGDGVQVHIPSLEDHVPTPPPVSTPASRQPQPDDSKLPGENKIDINTATAQELEMLPDIGPARAEAIIAYRPYGDIADITRVPGIGEATFQKLRDLITVH